MSRLHNPSTAPPLDGNYSQGVEVHTPGRLLHVSGQVPETPDGAVPDSFGGQCERAWANIIAVLESARMTVADLVKVTTFLSDRAYREANSTIRQNVLGDNRPALTIIITGIYEPKWLLEIEAVAFASHE